MNYIPRYSPTVKPASVLPYFDRVQVWIKSRASASGLKLLRENSGHLYVENSPARFDYSYLQRIELKQPKTAALEWVAARSDALVNRVEIALDYICATEIERDDLYEFFDHHLVRRWHSAKHEVRLYAGENETRYDAPRSARSSLVTYKENYSRITGELNVVRIEWRATGVRAVRSAGITGPRDLLDFDHREFWEKRLVLLQAGGEKLGRYVANRKGKERRRISEPEDKRRGHVMLNSVENVQSLLDEYRTSFRIGRALERIDVQELLPVRPVTGASGNE